MFLWKIGRNPATVFNAHPPARRKRTGWSAGWLVVFVVVVVVVVVFVVVVMIVFVCVCVVVAALLFIVMPLSDCKVWRRDRGLGGRRGGGGAGQGEWTTCAKQSGLGFIY